MRIIKFRAWDKEYNCMIQPDDIAPWNYELITGEGQVMEFEERHSYQGTETNFDDISDKRILMQYTGLKDNNGKEIYEGDIAKGHWWDNGKSHRHIGVVKYGMASYSVVGIKQYLGMSDILNPTYEIIGNIYENPELIES